MIDHYSYKRRNRFPGFLAVIVLVLIIGFSGMGLYKYISRSEDMVSTTDTDDHKAELEKHINLIIASNDITPEQYWIRIRKSDFILELYKGEKLEKQFPIAVGAVSGDKVSPGDDRTPEGAFPVMQIQDSKYWVHDFGDGKGPIEGAYGPFFIRLDTGWGGIGIHGTHDPSSIGSDITAGCVRMLNDDLLDLLKYIKEGSIVVIEK